jgi:diguanylate cyclase (GGDEF)-like protein/PAS domain S-box-containing protein
MGVIENGSRAWQAMTHLVKNSNKAIYSLAFKMLLSLAIAALPALVVATILGITLVTVVDEAKQDFERAMSASRRLTDVRVLAEKELGLVSRIPAELDQKKVDRYAQQIINAGLRINAEIGALVSDERISSLENARKVRMVRNEMTYTAAEVIEAARSFSQTTALELVNGPYESSNNRLASLFVTMEANVDRLVERARRDLNDSSQLAWRLTPVALAVAVLAVAFGFWMIRRYFIRPVLDLANHVVRIRQSGELDVRSDIDSLRRRDEIGALSRSFDQMIAELADARRWLIARSEAEINTQYERFNAAIDNMPQGLCMFDGEQKLIVSNRRYAEIYGLDPEDAIPGTSLRLILARRAAISMGAGNAEDYVEERVAAVSSRQPWYCVNELANGRMVAVSHQPMPSGGSVATHEDITERRKAEAQIERLAHYDALTNLPNRVSFRANTDRALSRVERGDALAVLCLDLDHFKEVNDTLGHPVGDALLQAVADRIRACVRPTDCVARLGGDEFAIVQVPADQPVDCIALATRLIAVIAEPYDIGGHQIVIGASVGIAIAPNDGSDFDHLLKHADMALYRAKENGRGTYRFFEPEMDARIQAKRALELDLRKALALGEFELFYQPLIDLATNKVSCFEALLRWRHPQRGMVMPGDFIPLAEETGLICSIGAWVLKKACTEAVGWPGKIMVAVNLSSVQFKSGTLVLDVISALGESGLPAHRLELEITETVLLQDTDATMSTLNQLRDLGAHIAMDDFGTGYSSLGYLQKFPFDKIKIDQSFVRDLIEKPESVAIVRAVTGLGSALGMATTAEGVETIGQLEQLRREGCTEVQGYLFSKPTPAHELGPLLLQLNTATKAVA